MLGERWRRGGGRGGWGVLAGAVAAAAAAAAAAGAHGPVFESQFVGQSGSPHLPLRVPALSLRALGGGQRRGRLVDGKMRVVEAAHF